MITDVEPSGTELYDAEILTHDKRLLIYRNTIATEKNELMIVPFPLDENRYDECALADIKYFEEYMSQIRDSFGNIPYSNSYSLNSYSGPAKLHVHQVGNYQISIAPNLDELTTRVDWDKFTLPVNFQSRLDTLKNEQLYPWPCGYVVAEVNGGSVSNDGFALAYPNPGFAYFPTAHEDNGGEIVYYDVDCYAAGLKEGNFREISGASNKVVDFVRACDGKNEFLTFRSKGFPVSKIGIKGMQPNRNIILGDTEGQGMTDALFPIGMRVGSF